MPMILSSFFMERCSLYWNRNRTTFSPVAVYRYPGACRGVSISRALSPPVNGGECDRMLFISDQKSEHSGMSS